LDLIKDYFLEANPNPAREGCPDEKTLQGLAEDKLPPSHPARLHLASCSECFAEYRGYRLAWKEASKKRRLNIARWSIAAGLLVAFGGSFWGFNYHRSHQGTLVQMASSQPVHADVNLLDAGTSRGLDDDGASPLQEVSLPAAIVDLSVTLPRFSQAGHYEIRVSKDKAGSVVVAQGSGEATGTDDKTAVSVVLDLRAAKAGMYFLATVRGADNGVYYYPLKINQ
jgi:hypothetical protein